MRYHEERCGKEPHRGLKMTMRVTNDGLQLALSFARLGFSIASCRQRWKNLEPVSLHTLLIHALIFIFLSHSPPPRTPEHLTMTIKWYGLPPEEFSLTTQSSPNSLTLKILRLLFPPVADPNPSKCPYKRLPGPSPLTLSTFASAPSSSWWSRPANIWPRDLTVMQNDRKGDTKPKVYGGHMTSTNGEKMEESKEKMLYLQLAATMPTRHLEGEKLSESKVPVQERAYQVEGCLAALGWMWSGCFRTSASLAIWISEGQKYCRPTLKSKRGSNATTIISKIVIQYLGEPARW